MGAAYNAEECAALINAEYERIYAMPVAELLAEIEGYGEPKEPVSKLKYAEVVAALKQMLAVNAACDTDLMWEDDAPRQA